MITYLLNVRMADSALKINEKMLSIISECTAMANDTIVSKREKRTFEVLGRVNNDEYTIQIQLSSKNACNPTRSLSTLSRKVLENNYMSEILEGHTPNGSVFKAELVNTDEHSAITYKSDPEIVSEIISIFFDKQMSAKGKDLASNTAEIIRGTVLDYINKKNSL